MHVLTCSLRDISLHQILKYLAIFSFSIYVHINMNKPNLAPEAQIITLAHGIGDFIQYWGFRRIHGQVWTLIYLSKEPIHATEIVARLGVSKALISLAINELVGYGLIIQTSEPDRKIKTYAANPKIFAIIRDVLRTRELDLLKRIVNDHKSLNETLGDSPEISAERLAAIGEMAMAAYGFLSEWLAPGVGQQPGEANYSALTQLFEMLDP